MNASIELRPATQDDWPAIASLLERNKLPLDGAREHLSAYLLASRNGEVAGCAGFELYADRALLRSVAVAPDLQGQGIGHAMVAHLLQDARLRGIATVFLLTIDAPEYFARFGFARQRIDQAPPALKASAEFRGACPTSAVYMVLTL
jgi:N-acetylglutamate synthase-like GNAT family acetyltransferase